MPMKQRLELEMGGLHRAVEILLSTGDKVTAAAGAWELEIDVIKVTREDESVARADGGMEVDVGDKLILHLIHLPYVAMLSFKD